MQKGAGGGGCSEAKAHRLLCIHTQPLQLLRLIWAAEGYLPSPLSAPQILCQKTVLPLSLRNRNATIALAFSVPGTPTLESPVPYRHRGCASTVGGGLALFRTFLDNLCALGRNFPNRFSRLICSLTVSEVRTVISSEMVLMPRVLWVLSPRKLGVLGSL